MDDRAAISDRFFAWIDHAACKAPRNEVVAFCFNLYEVDGGFDVQLIGSARYDLNDRDWPCDERYTTGEDVFCVPTSVAGQDWEAGLATITSLLREYLRRGSHAPLLRSAKAVAVGFVDGDLTVLSEHPTSSAETVG